MGELISEPLADAVTDGADDADLTRACSGDHAAFTRLVKPLLRELHAHCYRLLGSTHDADDALQDALLRAWRGIGQFERRSSLRTWLYTVATRTSLDVAEARGKRAMPADLSRPSDRAVLKGNGPLSEVAWLSPYPDAGLAHGLANPDARYEQREAVELALVAALQHLPGNQRAALLLFDVLGFSAAEIAAIMDTSTTSVNSALARARRLVAARVPPRSQQQTLRQIGDAQVREIATRYATALQSGDAAAFVALLTEDVTWSMPPLPHWYRGIGAVTDFAVQVPITRCPSWRFRVISANAQAAIAFYLGAAATAPHEAFGITVLTLRNDRICEITSFLGAEHFPPFGLPTSFDPDAGSANADRVDAVTRRGPGWPV